MASAQTAYRLNDFEYAPQRASRPDVRVVAGTRTDAGSLPPSIFLAAKVIAVAMVVFALVAMVRIGLQSAAVSSAVEGQELSSQIKEARSYGNDLEITQTSLTNNSTLRAIAAGMGMEAPEYTSSIVLEKDVVATDGSGNLSLSQSVRNSVDVRG
ncbi:MAG: cell division protein FtsL [Berryella intestinalis]|uniref:cell division protein FtsL n=1 Tax=Berryella intestinalis TaxID=1531429 RepID=UPI002A563125|nr:cell division protein FtsL [Berryella intestinalis]MDD7369579.1 cell division protein FtsL [Berryella intestinalis]MDY3129834.1 cell division protein FtsL [Berryella intestinalis]